MKISRLIRYTLVGLLAVILLAVATGLLLLDSRWGTERARRLIVSRANQALAGRLSIDTITGTFIGGNVTLAGVTLVQDGLDLLRADEIRLRYSVPEMFSGVSIAEVVLVRPRVVVAQDPDTGTWNVAKMTRGTGGGRRPSFSIRSVGLIDGDVQIQPKGAPPRHLTALDTTLGLESSADWVTLDISSFRARDADTGLGVTRLSGDLRIGGGRIEMANLDAATDGSVVSGHVATAVRHDPATDAAERTFEFDIATRPVLLRELGLYLPALSAYPASAAIDAKAKGSLEAFTATWTLASDAGRGVGSLEGRSAGRVLTITGDVDADEFKVREWFRTEALPEVVDAKSTYEIKMAVDSPHDVTVSFEGTVPSATVAGYAMTAIRARGTWANGRLNGRGAAAAYGAVVAGAGSWDRDTRAYSAEGTFSSLDLRALPERTRAPKLASNLSGRAIVHGEPSRWSVDAVLGPSEIEGAELAEGFTAGAEGRGETLRYRATGTVRHLDPRRFAGLTDTPPEWLGRAAGDVNAHLDFTGSGRTLEDMQAHSEIRLERSTLPGVTLDRTVAVATLDRGSLAADISAEALTLADNPMGYETGPLAAAGSAVLHVAIPDVTAPISLDTVDARGSVTTSRVAARDVDLTRGEADFSLAGGILTLSEFELAGRELNASAAGTAALAGTGASNLTFKLSAGDLSRFQPFAGESLSGNISVEGRLTGSRAQPHLAGTAKGSELEVREIAALSLDSSFDLTVPDWKWDTAMGTAAVRAAFVEASGTTLDEVNGTAAFDNGRVEVDAQVAQGARQFDVGGEFVPHPDHREVHLRRLSVTAGGSPWRLREGQEAVVRYSSDRISIQGLALGNGASTLDVAGAIGDGATEPLTIVARGVQVADVNQLALGTRDLRGTIDATVTMTGPTSALEIRGQGSVVDGMIEGLPFRALTVNGGLSGRVISVDLALDAGGLGQLTATGTAPYSRNAPAGTSLPPFDVTVRSSTLDLGYFQPVTTLVTDLRGTGRIDLRVHGEASAPAFDGTVAITGGTFLVADTGITYRDLNADLLFAGQRLDVRSFRVLDDDGNVATIEGALNVPGLAAESAFELIIATDDFHLINNQFGEVGVTANLQALGTLDTPLVSGTITVDRGRLEVSDLLERLSSSGYRTTPTATGAGAAAAPVPGAPGGAAASAAGGVAPDPPGAPGAADAPASIDAAVRGAAPAARSARDATTSDSAYRRSSLSVTLDMPGNVVLRGRDLRTRGGPIGFGDINVTIGGALSIAKETGEEAVLLGRVDVVRGQYQFQGRQFAIARGSELRFQGSPTNPALDVTAERTISGVTAEVHVTGTASRPEIRLSSDPPLDEGDILSLIVFNQPMNELPGSERVSLAARAGAMAAGAIATPLADSVARALDLDLFEIRPSELAGGGASVRIGRQVSDRLFLGFSQEFGREEISQLSFEYRLNEMLSVVTSLAHGSGADYARRRAQQAGVDLIFMVR